MITGVCIEREVRVNLATSSGEWMGDVYCNSNNQTFGVLYRAEAAGDEPCDFDTEEAAINYIVKCWEASDAN